MDEREYLESAPDVLFVLKVDIGGGRKEFIRFCKEDSPEDLAFDFCKTHGFNVKVYDFVADSLRQKYHQLQSGQLTESKSRAVGPQEPSPVKHSSGNKPRDTANTRPAPDTKSSRRHDRPTAADSNPNLLASLSKRVHLGQQETYQNQEDTDDSYSGNLNSL